VVVCMVFEPHADAGGSVESEVFHARHGTSIRETVNDPRQPTSNVTTHTWVCTMYTLSLRGFRASAVVAETGVTLWSCQGNDLTRWFPDLATALAKQVPPGCVIDGEALIWAGDRLDFIPLQQRKVTGRKALPAAFGGSLGGRARGANIPSLKPVPHRDTFRPLLGVVAGDPVESVPAEVGCVFPDAICRHFEPIGHTLPPFRGLDRFPPVVRDVGDCAVDEFSNGDVAVEASVAVVAGPFDDDGGAQSVAAADFQGESGEVAFDVCDELAASDNFAHLRPLADGVLVEGSVEEVFDAGGTVVVISGDFGHTGVPSVMVSERQSNAVA